MGVKIAQVQKYIEQMLEGLIARLMQELQKLTPAPIIYLGKHKNLSSDDFNTNAENTEATNNANITQRTNIERQIAMYRRIIMILRAPSVSYDFRLAV